jgi:dihydrofolate reductase
MQHYIFSNKLALAEMDDRVQIKKMDMAEIDVIQNMEGTPIYLCGGGQFAGWLLDHGKIDTLKIKLNPLIQGKGVRLFGNSTRKYSLEHIETAQYDQGLQIITYRVNY